MQGLNNEATEEDMFAIVVWCSPNQYSVNEVNQGGIRIVVNVNASCFALRTS